MERDVSGFWNYVAKWRQTFGDNRAINWENSWIKNDFCKDCRFCCGAQDSSYPFPMPLLARQLRPGLELDFHLLDASTPYLGASGCRSLAQTGCRLALDQKPLVCGLFPIVLVNGALYLYQNCPAVIFSPLIRFLELARPAAQMLAKLDLPDLRKLSLWLTDDLLARSYIDLRITLFNEHGKELSYS